MILNAAGGEKEMWQQRADSHRHLPLEEAVVSN